MPGSKVFVICLNCQTPKKISILRKFFSSVLLKPKHLFFSTGHDGAQNRLGLCFCMSLDGFGGLSNFLGAGQSASATKKVVVLPFCLSLMTCLFFSGFAHISTRATTSVKMQPTLQMRTPGLDGIGLETSQASSLLHVCPDTTPHFPPVWVSAPPHGSWLIGSFSLTHHQGHTRGGGEGVQPPAVKRLLAPPARAGSTPSPPLSTPSKILSPKPSRVFVVEFGAYKFISFLRLHFNLQFVRCALFCVFFTR